MTRTEAQAEAARRNLAARDTGVWAAHRYHGEDWRVVRLVTSGIGRRAGTDPKVVTPTTARS